jgi:DNA-binding response OmpR family regulator
MVPTECGFAPLPLRVLPRVLLVEDDCRSHQLLRTILLHEGCDVISAMTQAGGLDRVGGGLDCVILDLRLPDGDGEAILKKIRSEHLPLRVAVTTAEGDPERLRKVNELAPDLMMCKPIDLAGLVRWLKQPTQTCATTPFASSVN